MQRRYSRNTSCGTVRSGTIGSATPADLTAPRIHELRQGYDMTRKVFAGLAIVCLMTTGCQLDRTSFQMDSNNRIPFLGFQLSDLGHRQKDSDQLITVRAESASVDESTEEDARTARRRLGDWLDGLRSPERISLPRTDSQSDILASTIEPAEFSNEF